MTVAHLLAFLSARGHAVDLFALESEGRLSEANESWLREHTHSTRLFRHTKAAQVYGILKGLLKGLPLQVGIFTSSKQLEALRHATKAGAYDLIYVYYLRSAEAARSLGKTNATQEGRPVSFLAMQLSQSLNTRRIFENAPNLWTKLLYLIESRLIARYETRIWREFTKSVLIGVKDVEAINQAAQRLGRQHIGNYVFGAHGTDIERFKPGELPTIPNRVVFSGVMRTPTNVQAVQWFVRRVWPIVRERIPEASFEIVGREPADEVIALSQFPGVTVTGAVPDPAANIAQAQICVNPMQAGGGMQNKLIEFLASRKAVVATSVANEGILAPADAISIADAPEEFAAKVVHLLTSPDEADAMAERGREFVVANWTWEAHFLRLEQTFYDALAEGR